MNGFLAMQLDLFRNKVGCFSGERTGTMYAGDEPALTATFSQHLKGETLRVVSVVFGRMVHQPPP